MLLYLKHLTTFAKKTTYMKLKHYNRKMLFIGISTLLLITSSCSKDEQAPPVEKALELPAEISLSYGEEKTLTLPSTFTEQGNLSLKVEFSKTENIQINASSRLHDKLNGAIRIDDQEGKVYINSALLYPNGSVSSISGVRIPETYQLTVIASASNGSTIGEQTISVRVSPGKVGIKGHEHTGELSYAYVLYSDKGADFELEAPAIASAGTTWYLPNPAGEEGIVQLEGNQIQFASTAGDPAQKAEMEYDLSPALQKDGFTIASTTFRVIFIPQIKFFYGIYYPEYNLTIRHDFLHIGLSNGYLSAAPTLYPEKYKSTFAIISIEKDGQTFENKDGIFEINMETGSVKVKKDDSLQAGSYKITVKAITTTGLTFITDLTLSMSAG